MEFKNLPEHGVIESIVVKDSAKQSVNLDIVLFGETFTATADNAAFAPSNADLELSVGSVLIDVWKAFANNSQGVVDNVGLLYWCKGGTLFAQLVTRGTPTYAAVTDVSVRLGIVY